MVGRMAAGSFAGIGSGRGRGGAYRDLEARSVQSSGAPERQAWGGIVATFVDPSGNELQLVELPAAR